MIARRVIRLALAACMAIAGDGLGQGFKRGQALMVFHVVDETGQSVSGVDVLCTAWWPATADHRETYDKFEGLTGEDGELRATIAAYHDVSCRFRKSGYYDSRHTYVVTGRAKPALVDGKWQPWGKRETVVLKRIRNPVPMYVKEVDTLIPVLAKPMGYDLEKGDWVAPHGKGLVPDFLFTAAGRYGGKWDVDIDLALRFSSPSDGIVAFLMPMDAARYVGSRLLSAHEAPADGYQPRYDLVTRIRLKGRTGSTPTGGAK